MGRVKGEGSIYYIEKRKKWAAQITNTVAGKQVRKTVYGDTKKEVSEKLLELRVQMKDIGLIRQQGISIIDIMKEIRDKKLNSNIIKEELNSIRYGHKLKIDDIQEDDSE